MQYINCIVFYMEWFTRKHKEQMLFLLFFFYFYTIWNVYRYANPCSLALMSFCIDIYVSIFYALRL